MDQKEFTTAVKPNATFYCGMLCFFLLMLTTPTLVNASLPSSFSKGKIDFIEGNNKTNIIPLLNNRFRLDANLDEITMIFYRERGSKPVILIKPDGAKVRIIDFDTSKVQWYEDSTFDMIKIKKPMPGPWQAIGDVKANSKILIVSDIKIVVEPLPAIIFKGETLKVTGTLLNGEHGIDDPEFRDVITLEVHFFSENKVDDSNFGAESIKITTFKDDGQILDEYAGDGVFTGEFDLNLAPGSWRPTYLVKLPMAVRELSQNAIQLFKPPIDVNVKVSHREAVNHQLKLKLATELVDAESVIFEGKIVFPDRQVERFSIMESKGSYRTKEIKFTESGIYRVDINAFGKTIDGRDFRLSLEQYTFNVDPNILRKNKAGSDSSSNRNSLIDNAKSRGSDILNEIAKEEKERQEKLAAENIKQAQEEKSHKIMIIVLANVIIILIALVLFFVLSKRKGG